MRRLAVLAVLLAAAPAFAAPKTITVGLGKTFVLRKGQAASLRGTDAGMWGFPNGRTLPDRPVDGPWNSEFKPECWLFGAVCL